MFYELLILILTVILAILITVLPFFAINIKPRVIWGMSKLPGPKALPLIGLAFQIVKLRDIDYMKYLINFRLAFPRLISFWVVGCPYVMIFEADIIETLLSSSQHIKKGNEYEILVPWLQEGLLISFGEKWFQRRKLLTPAFHFKILENNLSSLNKQAKYLVRNMLKKDGEPFVAEEMVIKCTLDVICETAMGCSLNLQTEQGGDVAYLMAVKKTCELVVQRMFHIFLSKEWFYSLFESGKLFFKNVQYLHSFTEKIIKDRKLETEKSEHNLPDLDATEDNLNIKRKKAFLDILIDLDKKNGGLFTDKDIREEVDTFMFEGHDTTSAAIIHALYLLGRHPNIQEKAYQELFSIFGDSDRAATNKDLHEMHYLEMVIKETLRLYPSVPYISRNLTHDLKLKDNITIPAGVNVGVIPFILHRDERYYPNPEVFDPERFSFENCKGRHPFAYIPFSAGPRNCIGQKFAMMELKVTISTIIRFSKVESINEIDESQFMPLVILRAKEPVQIKVAPRN